MKVNNEHHLGLPRMEALVRIGNIPLIESGVKTAEQVYYGLKVSTQNYFDLSLIPDANQPIVRVVLLFFIPLCRRNAVA